MPPGTVKTGTIAASQTWGDSTNPGPIRVTGNVTINNAVTVRGVPGLEVVVEGNFEIRVQGSIQMGGTKRGRIVFRSDSGAMGAWKGIVWHNSLGATVESFLEYCDIRDAAKGVDDGLVTDYGNNEQVLKLVRCRVENCDEGLEVGGNANVYVQHTTFRRNRVGVLFGGGSGWPVSAGTPTATHKPEGLLRRGMWACRFTDNEVGLWAEWSGATSLDISNALNRFYGNRRAAAYLNAAAGGASFLAEGVWWGSDTGPSGAGGVAGGLGDAIILGSGGAPATSDLTPWTELGLYARPDDVRVFCDALLRETGTSAVPSLDTALEDDDLEVLIARAQGLVDSMLTDEPLEKPYLARGTQTNEEVDVEPKWPPFVHRTRYRPIRAVTSVDRRDGAATWTALTNDEASGWWASERMLRDGLVHIAVAPTYSRSSFRLTYTHGFDDVPEAVKDATVRAAAIDVLHAIVPPAAPDPYAARVMALREDLAAFEKRNRGSKVGWSL